MTTSIQLQSVVGVLLQNEKNAENLYLKMADALLEDEFVQLFTNLAIDEVKHQKIYAEIMERVKDHAGINVSEHELEYFTLLENTNTFTEHDVTSSLNSGNLTRKSALYIAEKIERDGILYLLELKSIFPPSFAPQLETILGEERKHLKAVVPGGKYYPWLDAILG